MSAPLKIYIISMGISNGTVVTEFILLGFSDLPAYQGLLFAIFLIIYLLNLLGNLTMIAIIWLDPHLHTPMYFFLSHLSLLDICLASVTIPKLLVHLLSENKTVSVPICFLQMFCLFAIGCPEFYLLTAMAFDRYVAICHPLRYSTVMTRRVCVALVAASWAAGFLNAVLHTSLLFRLSFCGPNLVRQFFCDLSPLLALSCSDVSLNVMAVFIQTPFSLVGPFLFTLLSYARIICAILKMPSVDGKHKAFSICASHLLVVTLFYMTDMFIYLKPPSVKSQYYDRIVSLMCIGVTPMLNPFIYSLRNNEVKGALKKALRHRMSP